jgi:hypothetical protein
LEDDVRWFELAPHVGVNEDGSLQPLVEEGFTQFRQEPDPRRPGTYVTRRFVVRIRPYVSAKHGETVARPLTRVVCISDPVIAGALGESPKWLEIDPPKAVRPRRPRQSNSSRRRR